MRWPPDLATVASEYTLRRVENAPSDAEGCGGLQGAVLHGMVVHTVGDSNKASSVAVIFVLQYSDTFLFTS